MVDRVRAMVDPILLDEGMELVISNIEGNQKDGPSSLSGKRRRGYS